MTSRTLRVAIQPKMGLFHVDFAKDGTLLVTGGFEKGILQMILQGLQLDYTLTYTQDGEWGTVLSNGTWTGLIGMIQKSEVDLAIGGLTITLERMKIARFSYPYIIDKSIFVTKEPPHLSTYYALIRPFNVSIWVTLLAVILLLPICFQALYPSNCRPKFTSVFLKMFSILCRQSAEFRVCSNSHRILLSSWFLASMLLACTYISLVLAFMTVPLKASTIETMLELYEALQTGSYTCAIGKGSYIATTLARSQEKHLRAIGQYIIDNDMYVEPTQRSCLDYLAVPKRAFLVPFDAFTTMLHGNFHFSKDSFDQVELAVATRKDFEKNTELNDIIHRVAASGIFLKNKSDYYIRQKLKSLNETGAEEEDTKKILLVDLYGPFMILLIGYLLGIAMFTVEIINWKMKCS